MKQLAILSGKGGTGKTSITASFATLEVALNQLMAFALNKPQQVGHAILSRIRNIADRIEIIKAVSECSDHLDERQRLSIALVCKEALKLNARRNLYAHGMYEHRGKTIRVTPFAYSPRKSQPEVLKLKRVQDDNEKIGEILVMTFIFADLIPQEILDRIEELRE